MKTHILAATLIATAMAGINPAHAGAPAGTPGTRTDTAPKQEIRLERLTPEYWRVTLDNPPFNIFGPQTIPQLNSVITQAQKKLLFLSTRLTDGIELSDDRLPVIRAEAYALSFARRGS